jgi:hypothetical protein
MTDGGYYGLHGADTPDFMILIHLRLLDHASRRHDHDGDITATAHLGNRYAESFPPLFFLLVLSVAGIQTPNLARLYRCPNM